MDYEDQPLHQPDPVMGPPNYAADPPPPISIPTSTSNSIRPPSKLSDPLRRPKYRECLKNHALAVGGHAVDGCGEFMPAGDDGTIESLRCAACNCHRNFHRRETEAPAAAAGGVGGYAYQFQHPGHQQMLTHGHFGFRGPAGGYLHNHLVPALQRPPPTLALPSSSAGGGGSGSRDEMEDYYSNPSSSGGGKKRFRTKFTQEQKEKMLSVAARLDWKIQKQDEELVQQLCGEIGVKRHVFKVWMHNNKNTLGKKI